MAAPVRPRPNGAPAATADNRVNFGDDAFYSGGAGIPEGRYACYFDSIFHQYEKTDGSKAGPEFLAIRVAAYALEAPDEEPRLGYYGMGRKAILSFMPNPDDEGKSLLAVPGGPATSMNDSTNWNLFRKSMLDCGMPPGTLTNDLRAIDGVWLHIVHIPEPEERKGFGAAATGEAQPEPRRNQTIAVCGEILDGGKPWEGGGGIPEAKPAASTKIARMPTRPGPKAPPAAPPPGVAARAPGRAPARPAAAPPPPAVESPAADEDLLSAAQNAAASVIETSPNGIAKLVLRTGVFKAATKVSGDEVANAVLETYFTDEAALNTLLGTLGYVVDGTKVVPIAAS